MARSLKDVKARCEIEGGHWLWTGALSAGLPNIYAPDYTTGGMSCQRGARAVWHLHTGQQIPNGWRVFSKCREPLCVNPAHVECKPMPEWGKDVAESGRWRGNMKRIAANRRTARARSNLTPEKVTLILSSDKTGNQLARELGSSRSSVSRIRAGHATAFTPVSGLFTGLVSA